MIQKPIIIDGRAVTIQWDQGTARRYQFRMAKYGLKLNAKHLTDPHRAHAAFLEILWLLLPDGEFQRHASAEDLAVAVDMKAQAENIVSAVTSALVEMTGDDEKKTAGVSTHSPASNSGSARRNGTASTPRKPAKSSTPGRQKKGAPK